VRGSSAEPGEVDCAGAVEAGADVVAGAVVADGVVVVAGAVVVVVFFGCFGAVGAASGSWY
jgi:hypothetical protein